MASTTEPMPAVTLDFGGKGNAWDDRELVNAYDAALLEFHIHNPGPGSWLDKATAALAKGQPLPGATSFGTSWYTASKPEPAAKEKETPARKKHKPSSSNPYTSASGSGSKSWTTATATKGKQAERADSPTYQPASPGGQWDEVAWPPAPEDLEGGEDVEDEDGEEGGDEEEGWQGYDGFGDEGAVGEGHVFPPPSGEWAGAGNVGRDEAIGYALHAQYWAGYWMGVAHGASGSAGGRAKGRPSAPASRGSASGAPNGLRR